MGHGFFKCVKGHKSSRRLVGIPCGFAGMLLSVFGAIVCTFTTVNHPKLLLGFCGILFTASFIYLGLTTVENIINFIRYKK